MAISHKSKSSMITSVRVRICAEFPFLLRIGCRHAFSAPIHAIAAWRYTASSLPLRILGTVRPSSELINQMSWVAALRYHLTQFRNNIIHGFAVAQPKLIQNDKIPILNSNIGTIV